MRKFLRLAAIAITLCGCQTPSYLGNEDSPFYIVPTGSRLILEREIEIPADQLAAYIQNGRVLRNAEVNHLYPFCKFDLYRLARTARTVKPDDIVVAKTTQEMTQGAITQAAPLQLARNSLGLYISSEGGPGGPVVHSFSTRMDLRSEKQPDIFRLTCAQWGYLGIDRHVTIGEIRRTLAGVMTLRLPQ